MVYKYKHLIPQNIAPKGVKNIGVYNSKGNKVYTIPLEKLTQPNKEKLYSFGLVSDIHFYKKGESWVTWNPEGKFDNVLTLFENDRCVFCIHCGDITQTGLYDEGDSTNLVPEQFANYKEVCDKHTIPVYGLCGNHESYVVPITSNLTELHDYTGIPATAYTISNNHSTDDISGTTVRPNIQMTGIGDDLFIVLSQPSGGYVMSDSDFQWLSTTLETNKGKRCFVFVHAYIEEDSGDAMDVRENSIFESWGGTRKQDFMDLIKQYKNIVLFHGHSHMKLSYQELDVCANYTEKNGFKSVHVPSSATPRDVVYDESTKKYKSQDDSSASEGYIVDVYDDCIVLNGMDFIDNKPIPLGQYKIDTTLQTIEASTFVDATGTIITG